MTPSKKTSSDNSVVNTNWQSSVEILCWHKFSLLCPALWVRRNIIYTVFRKRLVVWKQTKVMKPLQVFVYYLVCVRLIYFFKDLILNIQEFQFIIRVIRANYTVRRTTLLYTRLTYPYAAHSFAIWLSVNIPIDVTIYVFTETLSTFIDFANGYHCSAGNRIDTLYALLMCLVATNLNLCLSFRNWRRG